MSREDAYQANPGSYAWVKLIEEIQLGIMEERESAASRIFNAYGEYCEYEGTAQVVPALIRKAIRYLEEEFVVWGGWQSNKKPDLHSRSHRRPSEDGGEGILSTTHTEREQ